ncbi:hypothetical protein BGW80DRAFT_1280208 [Lactifluus volemus]|nr:hypothetical protein BGW80DRAFT_1280208 [Lactifluus volemus]
MVHITRFLYYGTKRCHKRTLQLLRCRSTSLDKGFRFRNPRWVCDRVWVDLTHVPSAPSYINYRG